jgi:hypothetical protein
VAVSQASAARPLQDRTSASPAKAALRDKSPISQFYGTSQGVEREGAIFLWSFPFFCAAEKPEKSPKLVKNRSGARTGHLGE